MCSSKLGGDNGGTADTSVSLKAISTDCSIFLADALESVATTTLVKSPGVVTFWLCALVFLGESLAFTAGWPAAMAEVKTPDSRRL